MKSTFDTLLRLHVTAFCWLLMVCPCVSKAFGADRDAEQGPTETNKKEVIAAERTKKRLQAAAAKEEVLKQKIAVNAALEQQFLQQFRPILQSELEFVRKVCDLSVEQRPKIKTAGEDSLKEAATKVADSHQRPRRVVFGDAVVNNAPNPRKIIHEGLTNALRETLTGEQMEHYTYQATKRAESRKRAAILNMVSRLDGSLSLTPKQRERISQSLSSTWQDRWEEWLKIQNYNSVYFPAVPNSCIVPHLNGDQALVWSGIQKVEFGLNYGWGGQEHTDDDGWWEGR